LNTYSNRVHYIYDENQKNKETQVISKLAELVAGFEQKDKEPSQKNQSSQIKLVSVQDALAELLELNSKL
jgi:hypothetical protein